jgi:flagellar biosynthesis protein FlhG
MDQASKLRDQVSKRKQNRQTKVISVTSGKGGVGKTQVTANLALALRSLGKEVLIFDGDMGLANIDIIYNISPPYNLEHLVKGEKTIHEVLCSGPDGVKVLPAASGIQDLTSIGSESKQNIISQLDQLEGLFDYVLIDTAAGISDNVMYLNTSAQYIFVVVTPEPTSITDAYALMKVLSTRYSEKQFHIITNQVSSDAEAKMIFNSLLNATDQFLDSIQLWHLHSFAYDKNVRQSITQQVPLFKFQPNSDLANSYRELAKKADKLPFEGAKGGMQFFLKQAVTGK